MASGPWDNVSLAGPPNGPQWIQAAMQAMQGTGNAVGGAFDAYRKGQEFQYQQNQRNLFQNGLPTDAQGNPNYGAMFQRMIQQGGSPVAQQVLPSLIDLSLQQQNSGAIHGLVGGAPQPTTQPAVSGLTGNFTSPQRSSTPNYPSVPYASPQDVANNNPDAENVQSLATSIASGRGIQDVPVSQMRQWAKAIGVNLDTPLNAQQESKARKLISYNLPNDSGIQGGASPNRGGGNPVAQPGNPDQENGAEHLTPSGIGGSSAMSPRQTSMRGQPLRVTVHPDQGAVAGDGFEDRFRASYGGNAGTQVAQNGPINPRQIDELERRAAEAFDVSGRAGMKPAQAEAARKIGEQLQTKAKELREQNLKYSSPEYNKQLQSGLAAEKEVGKTTGETISSYIKGMPAARDELNELSVIEDALRSAGGNLFTGPGAEAVLRSKQFLNNLGVPVKGLTQTEVMQKMNTQLASAVTRAFSQRPSQLEFRIFQQNLPGILNSPNGTQTLLNVMRQMTEQKVDLGQLAQSPANRANWSAVEDRYFREHPIHMPFSSPGGMGAPGAGGQPQGQTAPGRYQWTPQGGLQRVQ